MKITEAVSAGRAGVPSALLLLSALVGCADPKAPGEETFRKALEPVVADAYCRPLQVHQLEPEGRAEGQVLPVVVPAAPLRYDPFAAGRKGLELLAQEGLLTRSEVEMVARGTGYADQPVRQAVIRFEPTEKGRPYVRGIETRDRDGDASTYLATCLARGEVVDVVRWTEPSDMSGKRVSQVTYTRRGVDPIPFAPEGERAKLAQPEERTVAMELASDGWRAITR